MLAPWADVLYAADTDWWENNNGVPEFMGQKWTVSAEAAEKYKLNHINYDTGLVWGSVPGIIATGGNSGFQAINLAVQRGAKKIIMLGYDMGFSSKKHWWDGEIKRESRYSNYDGPDGWIEKFKKAAKIIPVPVVNVSRETALTCFPRANIEDVL